MLAAEYPGFPGDVTFTANTLTVPEQSYIDQAAENAETKGSVAADTSITAYTGASVNKTTGALTMSGGTAGTPDKLKAGDYIQYDCDSSKGVHGGTEQRKAERRDLPDHLSAAHGGAAQIPRLRRAFQGRRRNRNLRLYDLRREQWQPHHPLPGGAEADLHQGHLHQDRRGGRDGDAGAEGAGPDVHLRVR